MRTGKRSQWDSISGRGLVRVSTVFTASGRTRSHGMLVVHFDRNLDLLAFRAD